MNWLEKVINKFLCFLFNHIWAYREYKDEFRVQCICCEEKFTIPKWIWYQFLERKECDETDI